MSNLQESEISIDERTLPFFIRRNSHCLSCKALRPVNKHPWNTGIAKGAISSQMGYVCDLSVLMSSDNPLIFFDKEKTELGFSGCELHTPKDGEDKPNSFVTLKSGDTKQDIKSLLWSLLQKDPKKHFFFCGYEAYEIIKSNCLEDPSFTFNYVLLDNGLMPNIIFEGRYYLYIFAKGLNYTNTGVLKTEDFEDLIKGRIY